MPGLYLHIPFCKQACHYCDFHFSTSLALKSRMVTAIAHEIALRKDYLGPRPVIDTVYFGGGTPSLLTASELEELFAAIETHFDLAPGAEITLEANPDDLTPARLTALAASPINRLSIGLQTFHGPHLELMNRAHTAAESATAVRRAQDAGFENLSIDLIYGIPAPGHHIWEADLANALALDVPHISAYSLTIEPGTAFAHWERKGRLVPPPDDFVATQFELLLTALRGAGYEQYETSSFCRPGRHSRHNSAYWAGVPYLGLGPSAHSFDGQNRQATLAHNQQYVTAVLERHEVPATLDRLTPRDRANEYLITSLRTRQGTSLPHLHHALGHDLTATHAPYLAQLETNGWATLDPQTQTLRLTDKGQLLADQIALELFIG